MNLDQKYLVEIKSSHHFFDITIKIPKAEIMENIKSAHRINTTFNQIIIFAEAMKTNQYWNNEDIQRSLEKIVTDLNCFSNEINWIKSIYQEIKKT